MKKNQKNFEENFEEWLECSLAVSDSIVRTASPHSLDFIMAMAEKRILTTAIEMYRREKNDPEAVSSKNILDKERKNEQ